MKLNKILKFAILLLLLTIFIIIFNIQEKRYNLLYTDYHALKTAYEKVQENTSTSTSSNNLEIEELQNTVTNLQEKLDIANKKNSSLKKKIKSAKNKVPASTTVQKFNYLQIKFWSDNCNYQLLNENQYIYSDPFLSKKISKKRIFVSSVVSEDHLENGQTVYSAMSSKGLVYSSSYINLNQMEYTDYSISSKAISSSANNSYLQTKFWNNTEEKQLGEESSQKWYSDYLLSNEVKDSKYVRIISEIDHFTASNGVEVYSALTKDGNIVYMHEYPNLETVN